MFEMTKRGAVHVLSGNQPLTTVHVQEVTDLCGDCFENGQPRLVLDLSGVPLMDSAGLELLLGSGHLTQNELEAALSEHKAKGLKLGEALLQLGFVTEETLLRCLGQQLNIPFIRIREGTCDPAVVKLVPRPKADAYCALALFLVRGRLTVAMAEPQNLQHIDDLERITGYQVRPVLAARSSLEGLIPRCYEDNFAVDAV